MFDLGWVEVARPAPEIEPGATVVILVRGLGIACFVQACRIVEVIDEPHRRGFAYGTLEGHYERGEERFQVERDPEGNVHYDILAFSRPGRLLTALGYPLARRMQRRFARDSMAAMARAVRPDPED